MPVTSSQLVSEGLADRPARRGPSASQAGHIPKLPDTRSRTGSSAAYWSGASDHPRLPVQRPVTTMHKPAGTQRTLHGGNKVGWAAHHSHLLGSLVELLGTSLAAACSMPGCGEGASPQDFSACIMSFTTIFQPARLHDRRAPDSGYKLPFLQ